MSHFQRYRRRVIEGELRPYVPGEDVSSVAEGEKLVPGDYIGRNPGDHLDQYRVAAENFHTIFHPEPLGPGDDGEIDMSEHVTIASDEPTVTTGADDAGIWAEVGGRFRRYGNTVAEAVRRAQEDYRIFTA
jgi:hypothetical protein